MDVDLHPVSALRHGAFDCFPRVFGMVLDVPTMCDGIGATARGSHNKERRWRALPP